MLKYLPNVVTLKLAADACIGCGMCVKVCPRKVFAVPEGKAEIVDRDACIECGACALNCPTETISVRSGVGCASGVILGRLGKEGDCCCHEDCC